MKNLNEFFQILNSETSAKRSDIIEKDFHIHRLLRQLSTNDLFKEKTVFKGGTCLVKAYTGYYRFSEDIDLTWNDTSLWEGRSRSQVRRDCSGLIDEIIANIVQITRRLGFKFNGDKEDNDQIIISSGGRMIRLYPPYISELTGLPIKVKLELNLVEKTFFPFLEQKLDSYVGSLDSERLSLLFPDPWGEYTAPIRIQCYDIREIYIEKYRAMLTRIAYKLRDAIDLSVIEGTYGFNINDYQSIIEEKTLFMLDLYSRYQENLRSSSLPDVSEISQEDVSLLIDAPMDGLFDDIRRINGNVERVRMRLLEPL